MSLKTQLTCKLESKTPNFPVSVVSINKMEMSNLKLTSETFQQIGCKEDASETSGTEYATAIQSKHVACFESAQMF